MPAKKNKNARRKQKQGKQRISLTSNLPSQSPFPPNMVRSVNYSDLISLVEGTASFGVYQIYRTGDVYDPDYTGTGHQPMYFDQLCSSTGPYLNHVTYSVDFHVRVVNTSAVPIMCIAYPSMVTTAPQRTPALERPYAWKHLLPPTGTGGAMVEQRIHLDNPKFVGVPVTSYEVAYAGTYAASAPSPYMVFVFYGLGASIGSVVLEVNIVYKTKFFQLGNMGTS